MVSLDTEEADEDRLARAFPSFLGPAVRKVSSELSPAFHRHGTSFSAVVGTETVEIPYRLYYADPLEAPGTEPSPDERRVRSCIFSRSHDGHVRQRAADHLLASEDEWVVPFVIALVGEYVIEILETIWQGIGTELADPDSRVRATYQRFVRANPDLLRLTAARMDSYWACYYRDRYPDWDKHPNRSDYPGYRLVAALAALA